MKKENISPSQLRAFSFSRRASLSGHLLLVSLSLFFFSSAFPLLAQPKETLRVAGLIEPVEVVRDKWGMPHIFARNEPDLFFAQGFMAAADRLFQLELWRRKATGSLSAVFGRRFLQADIGSRLLRFRSDLETELNFYHPRSKEIIISFVRGLNAYIDHVRHHPELLPAEFSWLGFLPEPWTPEDVISRHNGLFRNATEEIAIGRAIHLLGPEQVERLLPFKPKKPDLAKEVQLDFSVLSEDILGLYQAWRKEINFLAEDIVNPAVRIGSERKNPAPAFGINLFSPVNVFSGNFSSPFHCPSLAAAQNPTFLQNSTNTAAPFGIAAAAFLAEASELAATGFFEGSNNWVISGSRTISGKPLLANDPHRALQLPSLRTWVHLVAPGWNVIGGGEPALPGVSIGHNEHGAFGLTIFAVDQEDLYFYETNPENQNEYRYQGSWERMKIAREKIRIKGEAPVEVELKFTRHGPVLYQDSKKHFAVALRAAWLEPGGAPYLGSLRLDQARTWQEFRQACQFFHTPSENLIWAAREGNIGWQAVGLAPRRKNFTGLVPVPGDGRFEWDGYLPILDLPHLENPPEGFIATANECNLSADFPYAVGYLWAEPFRSQRIKEVLDSGEKKGIQDMVSLQQDFLSIPARKLVGLLKEGEGTKESLKPVISRLLSWDCQLLSSSIEASIYVAWQQNLLDHFWSLLLPEEARRILPRRSLEIMLDFLTSPPEYLFGQDAAKKRQTILLGALEKAIQQLTESLGPDDQKWFYGQEKFHHALLLHPLSSVLKPEWRQRLDVGPVPRGGDANTVCATPGTYRQTSGATFRLIADLSNWDNCLGTNCPGQTADYRSPHYADLFGDWAEGRYFPVYYSRQKIMEAAEKVIFLVPSSEKGEQKAAREEAN